MGAVCRRRLRKEIVQDEQDHYEAGGPSLEAHTTHVRLMSLTDAENFCYHCLPCRLIDRLAAVA